MHLHGGLNQGGQQYNMLKAQNEGFGLAAPLATTEALNPAVRFNVTNAAGQSGSWDNLPPDVIEMKDAASIENIGAAAGGANPAGLLSMASKALGGGKQNNNQLMQMAMQQGQNQRMLGMQAMAGSQQGMMQAADMMRRRQRGY